MEKVESAAKSEKLRNVTGGLLRKELGEGKSDTMPIPYIILVELHKGMRRQICILVQ